MRPAILIALSFILSAPCFAQEQPATVEGQLAPAPVAGEAAAAPVVVAPAAPVEVNPDTAIFQRTPAVDGQIDPGEWDTFYSAAETPIGGVTAYANWDSSNLYIGFQASDLASLAVSLDLNDNGWYHGDDNLQILVTGLADGQEPAVQAQLYNSESARGSRLAGLSAVTITGVVVRAGASQSGRAVEMSLPAGAVRGLKMKKGARIGLRIAAAGKDTAYVPGEDPGAVFPCELVTYKTSGPKDLDVEFKLSDTKVVVGQKLAAKLSFKNCGKEEIPARYFVIGGEGRAAKLLDSEKRMLEGSLKTDQRVRHTFKTMLTSGMGLGAWAIGSELRTADDTRVAAVLTSFDVVEPYVFSVNAGPLSTDPQRKAKATLRILNNTDHVVYGKLLISVPDGWQVSPSIVERQFAIMGEDQSTEVPYELRVAQGTTPGEYEIKFEVRIGKDSFPVTQRVTVTAAPAEEKPERKKPPEEP